MVKIVALLQASLLASDLARARAFYEGVLGLQPSTDRPAMGFDGVWYDIARPAHGGRDRDVALEVADLEQAKRALDKAEVGYTLSRSGRPALFCRDPDGNAIELMAASLNPSTSF